GVGEHEHARAVVELRGERACLVELDLRIGIQRNPDRGRAHGRLADDLNRRGEHVLATRAMGDEKDPDHRSRASSASMNKPATSNPVWSWISRKQVGLVTFTSVIQSPMMSSPTSSRPRLASVAPRAWAISCCRADSGFATALAPAARLPRDSPAFGIRARQCGTGLPSMISTRWSPALISGMK